MKNQDLKPDAVLKDYWRNNDRFADLFNQVFFEGETVLSAENLKDKDTEDSAVIVEKGKAASISRARDLIKEYSEGMDLALVGIENQMRIHYGMPIRTMLYEALDYMKQCKKLEQKNRKNNDLAGSDEFLSGMRSDDKITAVVTLVIYYGEKPWNGPTSLTDMMDIPKPFQPLFNNHNIHLLSVRHTGKYKFKNKDNQDFFTLIDMLYNHGKVDLKNFREKYPDFDVYWETLAALGAATGTRELVDYALENEGGRIHMCTALESLKKEGIQAGIQEGIQTGIQKGIQKGIQEGIQTGIQEGIQKGILGTVTILRDMNLTQEEICEKIQKQYHLSKNEAISYLLKK